MLRALVTIRARNKKYSTNVHFTDICIHLPLKATQIKFVDLMLLPSGILGKS